VRECELFQCGQSHAFTAFQNDARLGAHHRGVAIRVIPAGLHAHAEVYAAGLNAVGRQVGFDPKVASLQRALDLMIHEAACALQFQIQKE
jgi:hypothetical protein